MFTPKNELIEIQSLIDRIKNQKFNFFYSKNRFSDQSKFKTDKNIQKSNIFVDNIINYINNSMFLNQILNISCSTITLILIICE